MKIQNKFSIELHKRDISLILEIQEYFGGIGSISQSKTRNTVNFTVSGIKDLTNIIIPHFLKYKLISKKAADFMCFTKIVELMSNNAHLKTEGLHKIINIKASMNLGLSDVLKSEFINITPVDRPIILTKIIPEPNWLTGFVSGEGCFLIKISKSNSHKIGYQVWLEFSIKQHERDKKLMWLISKYLGCGKIYKDSRPRSPVCYFRIIKFKDIQNKLIPFFEKYPLIGVK